MKVGKSVSSNVQSSGNSARFNEEGRQEWEGARTQVVGQLESCEPQEASSLSKKKKKEALSESVKPIQKVFQRKGEWLASSDTVTEGEIW